MNKNLLREYLNLFILVIIYRCKKKLYYEELPTASIVVPFHNEHFSVLLRTAYSALSRAPSNLIEVILVDDASTKGKITARQFEVVLTNVHGIFQNTAKSL